MKSVLKYMFSIAIITVLLLGNTVNSAWASPALDGTTPDSSLVKKFCPKNGTCTLDTGTAKVRIFAMSKSCVMTATPYEYHRKPGGPNLPSGLHAVGEGVTIKSRPSCGFITIQARICFPLPPIGSAQVYKLAGSNWVPLTSFIYNGQICAYGGLGTYLPVSN